MNLTALKNAILQRHLQKQQQSQMTFQIACGVFFKAGERALKTEPGELISESPFKQTFYKIKPIPICKQYSGEINPELSVTATPMGLFWGIILSLFIYIISP